MNGRGILVTLMIVLSMVCIILGRRQAGVKAGPIDKPNTKTVDTFDTNNLLADIYPAFTAISVTDGNETYSLNRTDSNGIDYDPNIIAGFLLALYKGFMEVEPNGIILTKEK